MGMTYRLTSYGKSRRSLPGVPWRDLSAEEYETACAANPGMDQRGYFERVDDVSEAKEAFTEMNKTLRRATKTEENPND